MRERSLAGLNGNISGRLTDPHNVSAAIALSKSPTFRESKSLQMRLETFKTFNHAQLFDLTSVSGEITNSSCDQMASADALWVQPKVFF
jgi:hypothetical protein